MNPEPRQSTAPRPVFLDLLRIRLPLPGIVSILHRISGVLMVLSIPIGAWAFASAVTSPAGFEQVAGLLGAPLTEAGLLLLLWAFLHHLFAGVRHLAMDIGQGLDLPTARRSAALVLGAGILATLALAWSLP